jgi:hypothetical protein
MKFEIEEANRCHANMTPDDCDAVFLSMVRALPTELQAAVVQDDGLPLSLKSQLEALLADSQTVSSPEAEVA